MYFIWAFYDFILVYNIYSWKVYEEKKILLIGNYIGHKYPQVDDGDKTEISLKRLLPIYVKIFNILDPSPSPV